MNEQETGWSIVHSLGLEDEFSPPKSCDGRCRDMTVEFVFCVVVPSSVVLLLSVVLIMTYFCCKSSKSQDTSEENEVQLERYNSIRRASRNLRELSHQRDSMLSPSRSGSISYNTESDRRRRSTRSARNSTYSAPSTLQRDQRYHYPDDRRSRSPPSYRLPPNFNDTSSGTSQHVEVYSGQENQRASLNYPLVYYQHGGEEMATIHTFG